MKRKRTPLNHQRRLRKEHSVAFVANQRIDHSRRIRRFGGEREPRRIRRRPLDRRAGLHEIAFEVHRLVVDMRAVENAAPFHLEGDFGYLREARRKDSGQGTLQIMIVRDRRGEPEGCLPRS